MLTSSSSRQRLREGESSKRRGGERKGRGVEGLSHRKQALKSPARGDNDTMAGSPLVCCIVRPVTPKLFPLEYAREDLEGNLPELPQKKAYRG
jgi:hypothetical protein